MTISTGVVSTCGSAVFCGAKSRAAATSACSAADRAIVHSEACDPAGRSPSQPAPAGPFGPGDDPASAAAVTSKSPLRRSADLRSRSCRAIAANYVPMARRPQVRLMETPPSTSIAAPVMKLDASDARNNAARAISSGWATRLSACSETCARFGF